MLEVIRHVLPERAEIEAAYRILHSEAFETEAIRRAGSEACVRRLAGQAVVLAIQDTTFFNFTSHPATSGMGVLGPRHLSGFLKHTVLAVTGDGVPLGLLHEQCWARDFATIGKKYERKRRRIEDKESLRWARSQRIALERILTEGGLPAETTVITVWSGCC